MAVAPRRIRAAPTSRPVTRSSTPVGWRSACRPCAGEPDHGDAWSRPWTAVDAATASVAGAGLSVCTARSRDDAGTRSVVDYRCAPSPAGGSSGPRTRCSTCPSRGRVEGAGGHRPTRIDGALGRRRLARRPAGPARPGRRQRDRRDPGRLPAVHRRTTAAADLRLSVEARPAACPPRSGATCAVARRTRRTAASASNPCSAGSSTWRRGRRRRRRRARDRGGHLAAHRHRHPSRLTPTTRRDPRWTCSPRCAPTGCSPSSAAAIRTPR